MTSLPFSVALRHPSGNDRTSPTILVAVNGKPLTKILLGGKHILVRVLRSFKLNARAHSGIRTATILGNGQDLLVARS